MRRSRWVLCLHSATSRGLGGRPGGFLCQNPEHRAPGEGDFVDAHLREAAPDERDGAQFCSCGDRPATPAEARDASGRAVGER